MTSFDHLDTQARQLKPEQLVEAIWLDQRSRWERGERVMSEEYLARYPSLEQDAGHVVDVIYREILLREEYLDSPTLEEYVEKFPRVSSLLRRQMELHRAVESQWANSTSCASRQAAHAEEAIDTARAASDSGPDPGEFHWPGFPLLGNYLVEECIGQGGMGTVFRAVHRRMNRTVALKILAPRIQQRAEAVERFQREVQTAASLNHPRIVTAYDADCAAGVHFLTMEYVDGIDLDRHVRLYGKLSINRAVEIIMQVAQGIAYVHQRGVIHRDIKPANIMIDPRGDVRILDVGLASMRGADLTSVGLDSEHGGDNQNLTVAGSFLGTLDYLAPEQARNPNAADQRCDIYSLGCTLYFLLVGEPVYPGGSIEDKLAETACRVVPSIRTKRADVPKGLDRLFQQMVAGEVTRRPKSMEDVVKRLAETRKSLTSRPRNVTAKVVIGLCAATMLLFMVGVSAWRSGQIPKNNDQALGESLADTDLIVPGQAQSSYDLPALRLETQEVQLLEPADPHASEFRARLHQLRNTHANDPIGSEVHELLSTFPWPCDALSRGSISNEELIVAGEGDAENAPDGVVAILGDSRLRTWNACFDLALHPTADVVVTGDLAMFVRAWHVGSGRLRQSLPLGQTYSVDFARDASFFLAGGLVDTTTVVNATSFEAVNTIPTGRIHRVRLSPDQMSLITCSWENSANVWNIENGKLRFSLADHDDIVWSAAFSPEGTEIATGGFDRVIKLWDAESGELRRTLSGHGGHVTDVAFSADGSHLASASRDATIRIWEREKGTEIGQLSANGYAVNSVVFLPDGKTLASAGDDRKVSIWEWKTGTLASELRGASDAIIALAASSERNLIAASGWDHSIQLWNLKTHEPVSENQDSVGKHAGIAFSPDGGRLAAVLWDGRIRVWDISTRQPSTTLVGHEGWVRSICFSPDGRALASAGEDSQVIIWDLATSRPQQIVESGRGPARSVTFSADGQHVAAGFSNGGVLVRNVGDGGTRLMVDGGGPPVNSVALDNAGQRLASCRIDGSISMWDLQSAGPPSTVPHKRADTIGLSFSRDGRTLAVAGGTLWQPGFVRAFDVERGTTIWSQDNLAHVVNSVAFGPNGRHVAASVCDGSVPLFDRETGEVVHTWRIGPRMGMVWSLAFSPDGRHIATANGNGTIYILRLGDLDGV